MLYAIMFIGTQPIVARVKTVTNTAELEKTGTDSEEIFKQQVPRSMDLEENFRRNLPVLMRRFGYSQAKLAKALGVNRSVVNSWLSGRQAISYSLANKLAKVFGLLDPSLLFSNTLEPMAVFQTEEEAIKFLAEKAAERREKDLDKG